MLRLVVYAPDGVHRFPVRRDEMVVGSREGCDIVLPYSGVAQRHARLIVDGETLRVEDLDSRRGVLVSGKRVREATLEVLDEVRLGSVTMLVEDVTPGEVRSEATGAGDDSANADRAENEDDDAPAAMPPARLVEHLAKLSDWVLSDTESRTTLESLVDRLVGELGGGALFLFLGDLESSGIKFVSASREEWLASGEELVDQVREKRQGARVAAPRSLLFRGRLGDREAWIFHRVFAALDRPYFMVVALPRFDAEAWSPEPGLHVLGDLLSLGLVHHVGRYEPILPGNRGLQDLTLDPRLVVGESDGMQRVLERLRGAVDSGVHVLLRGEPGVGKELWARSLHMSSPRRHGAFVAASGAGAGATQIEADLFGAEIPGKGGDPVRREGKLLLADGGTLFLDDVDQLPLEIQARLVRFLRSGEVEPAGSREARVVDVRLVAACRSPLAPAVARDQFRVDLAYRLSRFAIDVPPLRERKSDLPLLIQSFINRFCHETGKRVAGITTKAMTALLAYDYPGNLQQLENIVRQLVTLCPHGRPVEVSLLPEEVRESPITSVTRVEGESDLRLDRLVAACEESAIREALRRTGDNKSQAARLLGLSRNGLAAKMERLGV